MSQKIDISFENFNLQVVIFLIDASGKSFIEHFISVRNFFTNVLSFEAELMNLSNGSFQYFYQASSCHH